MNKKILILLFGFYWSFSIPVAAEETNVQPSGSESAVFEVVEGTHYDKLPLPLRTRYPGKIEVTEYFSYGCPHCFQFEPLIAAWSSQLPEDVVFNRTPAVWNPDYEVYAQSYYTAEALNVLEKIHVPLFQAIHVERKLMNDPESMARFFQRYGVDPMDFVKVYKSFGVRSAMQQAQARGRSYRVEGVPALIVNGKYRVEGKHAGSNTNMLPIVDLLIDMERESLKAESGQ